VAHDVDREAQRVQRELGLRVGELRRRLGITQVVAAQRLGMVLDNYIKIERGKRNVTLHTVVRLARALEVEVLELFVPSRERNPRPGRPRKKS
jgi:transcriptional regulator with XRE-family HTH domain